MVFARSLGILLAFGEFNTMSINFSDATFHNDAGIFRAIFSKAISQTPQNDAYLYILYIRYIFKNKSYYNENRHNNVKFAPFNIYESQKNSQK